MTLLPEDHLAMSTNLRQKLECEIPQSSHDALCLKMTAGLCEYVQFQGIGSMWSPWQTTGSSSELICWGILILESFLK